MNYALDPVVFEGLEVSQRMLEASPSELMRWSPWQEKLLADDHVLRLARTSNQIGKTTCAAADLVMEIRGTSPYRKRRFAGPLNCVLVGKSIEQLSMEGGPLEKLWELIPRSQVDSRIYFERGFGLRGTKYPAIPIVYGPGAGSVIRIRTYEQDPQSLAGATLHHVWGDEPMPLKTYSELSPRILQKNGTLTITMTPTDDMPDQQWLMDLCDKGVVSQHWVPMSEQAAWPKGHARPFLTDARIAAERAKLPDHIAKLRFDAMWQALVGERYLTAYTREAVRPFDLAEIQGRPHRLIVGADHGLAGGKQGAMLVAVAEWLAPEPLVWFIDEYNPAGVTTQGQDAQGILAMLARNGLGYEHVDEWIGDQDTGDGRWLSSKRNASLKKHLLRLAEISPDDPRAKWIGTPKKFSRSMHHGLDMLNAGFAMQRAWVHPRCVRFAEACEKFRGSPRDPVKDILDAGRYAFEAGIGAASAPQVQKAFAP